MRSFYDSLLVDAVLLKHTMRLSMVVSKFFPVESLEDYSASIQCDYTSHANNGRARDERSDMSRFFTASVIIEKSTSKVEKSVLVS